MSDDQYQLILTQADYAKLQKQKNYFQKQCIQLKKQLTHLTQAKELQKMMYKHEIAFLVQTLQVFAEKYARYKQIEEINVFIEQNELNEEQQQQEGIPLVQRQILCTKYEKLLTKLERANFLMETLEQKAQRLQQKYQQRQQQWLQKYQTDLQNKNEEIQKLRHQAIVGKQLENDMIKLLQELNSRCNIQAKTLEKEKTEHVLVKQQYTILQRKIKKIEQQLNQNKNNLEQSLRSIDTLKIRLSESEQANDYLDREIQMKLNDNKFLLQENKELKIQIEKLRDLRKKTRSKQIISTIDSYINQLHEDLFKMQGINYGEIKSILVNELQHIAKHIEGILRDINLDV